MMMDGMKQDQKIGYKKKKNMNNTSAPAPKMALYFSEEADRGWAMTE